ncbi:MAG: hypothetical protein AB7G22_08450 [Flavobacteriales bacterium]
MRNILSVLLVFTILNTFVGKTIHELFFHHHHAVHCEAKTTQHFHEQEASPTDLVCNFNLSASIASASFESGKVVLNELGECSLGALQLISENLFLAIKSLRAPPVC